MTDLPDELTERAVHYLQQWELRRDGPPMRGRCAHVLPVLRADGTPAVLKLQDVDDETVGEPVALQAWNGDSAVRLLAADNGTLLLERLDAERPLDDLDDTREATLVVAGLLAHLTATPAPPELRRLGDLAPRLLDRAEAAQVKEWPLLADCAAAVREVADEPGDRLLHWDLHFENVLAADRAPWLAIDPKPLAGDPGFELLPALWNRFDADEVLWRFDAMTEVLGLDRNRALAWTLGRVLQNAVWQVEEGNSPVPEQLDIAERLRARRG
ncbi:Hydroxyurea phosphotransferase [Streptomyces davaonensis JCM 4913]|uniref:Hydroxyurea phosphotransferase n=1 Tax=Streptomyces davaonensis (strain DSM 101723 / JCM 4913 / KCC S-0913 / 768) TaxID=1214101 RepID=K4R841_STRDJ|nr:aminoglycoside phosphotransferase family protein [Streptomyces davaonensis]CCK29240.1 Hydroxyurea phosphotransferase [Streptomyces davaonensis JCM 4913]